MDDINTGEVQKACTKCEITHPIHMFKPNNKKNPEKRCSWCKNCMNEYARLYRKKLNYPVSVSEKKCHVCNVIKKYTEFAKHSKDPSGLSSRCKTCSKNERLKFMKDVRNFLIAKRADAKKRAQKNDRLDFNISKEEWIEQYNKQNGICALTGITMTWEYSSDDNNDFFSAIKYPYNISPDRINSKKGYTPDNLQFVCNRINAMKNNMETSEFIDFCKKVVYFQENA